MNGKRSFASTSKIIFILGLLLLFLGGMVTALEASRLDFIPYSSYQTSGANNASFTIEEKILDIPVSEKWETLALDLHPMTLSFQVNNELDNTVRLVYEASVDESGQVMMDYGLGTFSYFDESSGLQVQEPALTLLRQSHSAASIGFSPDLWFEELKKGKIIYDDTLHKDYDTSPRSARIEVNQATMDKLEMNDHIPRFRFH